MQPQGEDASNKLRVLTERPAAPDVPTDEDGGTFVVLGQIRPTTSQTLYRHDLLGWMMWRSQRPGGGMKVKTTAAFIPESSVPRAELIAEFDRLQDEQMELLRALVDVHGIQAVYVEGLAPEDMPRFQERIDTVV